MLEWILILNFATGAVIMPRAFPNEAECIGAGELALPACTEGIGVFGEVHEACFPRRFTCVPQPRIRSVNPVIPIPRKLVCPECQRKE